MKCEKGLVLFACSPSDETCVGEARAYVKSFGLSPENVRIIKRESGVTVEVKVGFELEGNKHCPNDSA